MMTRVLGLIIVESTPCLATPQGWSPDYKAIKASGTSLHLPVPLEHWASRPVFDFSEDLEDLLRRCKSQDRDLRNILMFNNSAPPALEEIARLLAEHLIMLPVIKHAWRSSVEHLSNRLTYRRAQALVGPRMDTYLPLVDLRRPILGMIDAVSNALQDLPLFDEAYRKVYPNAATPPSVPDKNSWPNTLYSVERDLKALQQELNDEIHLVIGAVTVRDSDASKQQAERATLLTLVAAVYLPLTLVTSIFGMNIKEIDGNGLTYRACLEAFAVTVGCTILFALAYREWRRWRRRREIAPAGDSQFKYV